MNIFPAIDLKDGRCVRLAQGRAENAVVYSEDPVETALKWQSMGAKFLHIVDLSGAFEGRPCHTDVIKKISDVLDIPFEVGGGLRSDADIGEIINAGASRAIIGTRAVSDPETLVMLADKFGKSVAVGIDARGGYVQVKGWVEKTQVKAVDLAKMSFSAGISTVIYTDIATDGMLVGPNLAAMAEMADAVPEMSVVASGGVRNASDITALRNLGRPNISGVIIGKALYEGTADLAECMIAAAGK